MRAIKERLGVNLYKQSGRTKDVFTTARQESNKNDSKVINRTFTKA